MALYPSRRLYFSELRALLPIELASAQIEWIFQMAYTSVLWEAEVKLICLYLFTRNVEDTQIKWSRVALKEPLWFSCELLVLSLVAVSLF